MKYDHFVQSKSYGSDSVWIYRSIGQKKSNCPVFVVHGGHSIWKKKGFYKRKTSGVFAVEYIHEGDCVLERNNEEVLVSEGEFFFLHHNESHSYRTGPSGVLKKSYVALDGLSLESILSSIDLNGLTKLRFSSLASARDRLLGLISALDNAEEDSFNKLSVLAYEFLVSLRPPGEGGMPPLVRDVINYMYKNFHKPLKLEELADHAGVSAPHLNRLFRRYTHMSTISFFHDQKMRWVADLLASTSLTITEIAGKSGFDNPLYFSSKFRKHYNLSPSSYRKQHKNYIHPDTELL